MFFRLLFLGGPAGRKVVVGSISVFAIAAFFPAVSGGQTVAASQAPPAWSASLWSTQEYRLRNSSAPQVASSSPLGDAGTGKVRDQDLVLTLDGGVTGFAGHMLATLSAALWRDLDGPSSEESQDVLADARGLSQTMAIVYTASAEWVREGPLARMALGRQQANHGLPVTFDGSAVDLRFLQRRLMLFAFGGRTVHFFRSQPGFFENWLISGGGGLRLGEHVQIEVDSRYLHESILASAGAPGGRVHTNSYGLTAMVRWSELYAKIYGRGINRTYSHLGGSFRWYASDAGVGIDGMATAQLVTLGEIAESESPFFAVLGNSLPHVRARLETSKAFTTGDSGSFVVAAGTRVRQLLRDQPERFNRNTGALYVRAEVNDLPITGAFASVVGEWNMPTQSGESPRFFTLGGGLGYTSRSLKAEAGSFFQRFKVNYYRDVEELLDARTVYAMAALRILPSIELRARYVVEIVDRTIQSVYLTVREDL